MSKLIIYNEKGELVYKETEHSKIARKLSELGIIFEKWDTKPIRYDAGQDEVLKAYSQEIERINRNFGFKSIDVVSITPENPKKDELRKLFLDEHIHTDFEVRFFVDGSGTFYLHIWDNIYAVLCEKGDFISVPANTPHWFDMGEKPFFKAIRFFTQENGWIANFTGNDISKRIPYHDTIKEL